MNYRNRLLYFFLMTAVASSLALAMERPTHSSEAIDYDEASLDDALEQALLSPQIKPKTTPLSHENFIKKVTESKNFLLSKFNIANLKGSYHNLKKWALDTLLELKNQLKLIDTEQKRISNLKQQYTELKNELAELEKDFERKEKLADDFEKKHGRNPTLDELTQFGKE